MSRSLRALMVEDSERDALLLARALRRAGYELTYERVDTPEAMTAALERQTWDVVFSDFSMPRFSMTAALSLAKAKHPDLPFIIVSGTVGEEAAVQALQAGAHDFMSKDRLGRLVPAVERELREANARQERRDIEVQLHHARRMEAIGQLTGGLAHDFNNLLTIVIGSLELLAGEAPGQDRAALVQTALNASMRGAELTRQLLAFARRQPLEAKVFDLNELASSTAQLLRRTLGEQVSVELALATDVWSGLADPSQVESALLNLAINGRDAMPHGGRLTIASGNQHLADEAEARRLELAPGDYVLLSVTDTGTGIPPEILDRVFEPFFSTKPQGHGTGLGLSMVYGFAKQSGGQVTIQSEVGRGTTVQLYLPRAPSAETAAPAEPADERANQALTATILLVEDNADVRELVSRQLETLGHRVIKAADGESALELLRTEPGIDLLFTDIVMQGGMDGIALADAARALNPELKILFTSGYPDTPQEDLERIQATGVLTKPYRRRDLEQRLREVLSR